LDESIKKLLKIMEKQLVPFLAFVFEANAVLFALFVRNFHSSVAVVGLFF